MILKEQTNDNSFNLNKFNDLMIKILYDLMIKILYEYIVKCQRLSI